MMYKTHGRRRILLLCSVMLAGLNATRAQNESVVPELSSDVLGHSITNTMSLGLGGALSTFQDAKYSAVRYSGIGGDLRIGYKKIRDDRYWQLEFVARYSTETAATHGEGKTTVMASDFNGRYMVSVAPDFMVGARLDFMDVYYRTVAGLGNNSSHFVVGSHLYASGEFEKELNERWTLNTGLDLGFLSFMQENVGFAFSSPQVVLEGGDFDYQDEQQETPFGFKYYSLESLGQLLNLRTHVALRLQTGLTFSYHWHLFNYTQIKSYPLTRANHSLMVSFRIKNKTKHRSPKVKKENAK